RRHGVVLVLIFEEAEMMDSWMLRNRHVRRADQAEVHAVDERCAVVCEELEQLDAAFVLIDASDIDRKAIAHVELLAEATGVRSLWNFRSNADHYARN